MLRSKRLDTWYRISVSRIMSPLKRISSIRHEFTWTNAVFVDNRTAYLIGEGRERNQRGSLQVIAFMDALAIAVIHENRRHS